MNVDLTSGVVVGTLSGDASFNDTRAIEVGIVSPAALNVNAMTLREFSVSEGGSGSFGARIYDSRSGILLASSEAAVSSGLDQSITISIAARLDPGHTYRVGFFSSVGGSGSANGTDVDPAGDALTSYFERTGLMHIDGIFQSNTDAFPTTRYPLLPYVSLDVTQVPEASTWAVALLGFAVLNLLRRRDTA